MIQQSHKCVPANTRVSSKHSNITRRQLTSPPHPIPQPLQNHTHSTTSLQPITHRAQTLRTPQHQNPAKYPHCTQTLPKCNTNTRTPQIIPSMHNRKHTAQARTCPVATMTTPALSPDTATGAYRVEIELSPTCAHHKASQPHHKPVHPTSLSPSPPLQEKPLHLPIAIIPPT